MGEAKAVEYLQAFRNRRNWRSFTQTAEQTLDLSGRKVDVFGGENIPFCGQIWAVNHTARVDDPVNMTGRLVVPDMLDIVGGSVAGDTQEKQTHVSRHDRYTSA